VVSGYVRKRVTLRISKVLRVVALAAGISRRVYSDTRVIFITIIAIYIALAEKIRTPLIINLPGAGTGAILTSPSGDKLFYAIQLCFKPEHKVSNNIAEYEGLLAGLRAASALGIKCLIVKRDSQLVVNFSNKSYTP
jgi:hypothetical protein